MSGPSEFKSHQYKLNDIGDGLVDSVGTIYTYVLSSICHDLGFLQSFLHAIALQISLFLQKNQSTRHPSTSNDLLSYCTLLWIIAGWDKPGNLPYPRSTLEDLQAD
jgi:hypothetical protein